jgi:hypothetical protein
MVKDATLSRTSGDDERPAHTIVRIADPKRTHQQVQTLLTILAQCEHTLIKETDIGSVHEVNSKAEEAAAETYALAQAQLRNLVDDMPRWSLNASHGDAYLSRLAEAQHDILKDQKANLERMRMPHRLLNANVQFVDGVGWVAWLGPVLNKTCVHGIGRSPVEACYAFDEAFLKRAPQQKLEPSKTGRKRKRKK